MGHTDISTKSPNTVSVRWDGHDVVMLDAHTIGQLLEPARCLAALEETYRNLYSAPEDAGQSIGFKVDKGKFHIKAGLAPSTHTYFAAKLNANFPDNPKVYGRPTIQGLILLAECNSGRVVALLQSGALTGIRTAGATALAAKYGARSDSRTMTLIGCGAQARHQVAAVVGVVPIRDLMVFDTQPAAAKDLADWATAQLGLTARVMNSVGDAVRAGDVIVTCTTAGRAFVDRDMVPTGAFVAAVGADNPDKQEIAPEVFAGARILVDDPQQCLEYGDLAHAVRAGVVGPDDIDATLAELAAGVKPGRVSPDEIVIFDSTGTGVQDVAAAAAAFEAFPRETQSESKSLLKRLGAGVARWRIALRGYSTTALEPSWTIKI